MALCCAGKGRKAIGVNWFCFCKRVFLPISIGVKGGLLLFSSSLIVLLYLINSFVSLSNKRSFVKCEIIPQPKPSPNEKKTFLNVLKNKVR